MKTTTPLLFISALAVTLLLAPPTFAQDEDMTKAEAQFYARDLLEPEEERAGLDNIRDEREEVRDEDRAEDSSSEYQESDTEMKTEDGY
jgi:hypothetical protein